MPLKEMHLRPISRISSAVVSGVSDGVWDWEETRSWKMSREAGELRVNVAAAFFGRRRGGVSGVVRLVGEVKEGGLRRE
jgi:hypothetical protein